MTTNYDFAATRSAFFQEKVEAVAKELERLAEEVRREGRIRNVSSHGAHKGYQHVYSAEQVIRSVTSAISNLGLSNLISFAAEADEIAALQERGEL